MAEDPIETNPIADRAVEGLIGMLRLAGLDDDTIAKALLVGAFATGKQSINAADWARCLALGAAIIRAPEHETEQ